MLSIGEFSKICNVSTKTLRYYAEIGLILPNEINNETGYRYYSIEQLETMLFKKVEEDKLTITNPPMALFHSSEYSPFGLDTEFAIPIEECVKGTRDFNPGLCLKTVLKGGYSDLSSVYVKQIEYAEKEGYIGKDALFEMYVTDPTEVKSEDEIITEIYYPVKKIGKNNK